MNTMYAKEMNRDQFKAVMKENPIVILPIGALEEHGSHLPIGADTFEIEFVVERLRKRLNAVILPSISYGNCRSTYNFPGTISIGFDSLRSITYDIISEIIRHGGKKIIVISGHAGRNHMTALKMAAERAVKENQQLKIMVLSDYDLIPEFRGAKIPKWDGHAGMVETSRMMNIRPDISRKGRKATKPKDSDYIVRSDPEKLFSSGVAGDPRRASSELGKKMDDFILRRLIKLIEKNFG